MKTGYVIIALATLSMTAPPVHAQAVPLVERLVLTAARGNADDVGRIFRSSTADALKQMSHQPGTVTRLEYRFDRLPGSTPALRTEFRTLPKKEQLLAVELGESSHSLLRRSPTGDGLSVLHDLDTEGLMLSRNHGDFVLDGAIWLRSDEVVTAIQAATLSPKERAAVARSLGLASEPAALSAEHAVPLWRAAVRQSGNGMKVFWERCVAPHKAKWLAGGALAAYLAMPETFHDAAGHLTEEGLRRLSEMGIRTVSDSVGAASEGLASGIRNRFEVDPYGTALRLTAVVGVLALAVPAVRRSLLTGLRRITGWSAPNGQTGVLIQHTPFRE